MLISLMVDHVPQVYDLQMGAPISENRKKKFLLKNYWKACFTIFSGWCRIKKSYSRSTKLSSSIKAEPDVDFETMDEVSQGTEEETSTKKSNLRYDDDKIPSNPSLHGQRYRHKSMENIPDFTSMESRRGVRRCFSQAQTSLHRSTSRNSIYNGLHPYLNQTESRKSTTIMFSNSSGMIKPSPIQQNLECSLEDLCYGCTKKIKVSRDVLVHALKTITQEEEILTIEVKPGWKQGMKITFEGNVNERLGFSPANITFLIVEKHHPLFVREGNDLEIRIEIPLVNALTGCEISIPLLGGDTMNLTIDDIIYPGYENTIAGQGMPNTKDQGKRGNLKVIFLVEFPSKLTEEQQVDIFRILKDGSY